MQKTYGDRVQFLMVYIREAHPTDGWQVRRNVRERILVKQPTTLLDREKVARQMCTKLKISLPAVIDTLDDHAAQAYSAWPDRLYLVGVDGRIAYQSGPGPWGFRPTELEGAIKKLLRD